MDLGLALCRLYNFIRQYKDIDHELAEVKLEDEEEGVESKEVKGTRNKYMNNKREEIA